MYVCMDIWNESSHVMRCKASTLLGPMPKKEEKGRKKREGRTEKEEQIS
jgi:hypothetical protein